MLNIITANIIKALLTIVAYLPQPVLRGFSFLIAVIGKRLVKYRSGIIIKNLENSFPALPSQKIKKIADDYYHHLADMIGENLIYLRLNPLKMNSSITFSGHEVFSQNSGQFKHIIVMAGHQGNWEYFNSVLIRSGFTALAVYKPQSSRISDEIMRKIRSKKGVILSPMKETLRTMANQIQQDSPTALLLVADQTPAESDIHFWTDFLHQPTGWFTGGGKLALKFDLPVYYLNITKRSFGKYDARWIKIRDQGEPMTEEEITKKYIKLLQKNILEQPQIWLWSHRRWKYKPPKPISL